MKLKYLIFILLLPFLASCNTEDDVEEIFCSGPWYVGNYYGKANWDKRTGEPKYNPGTADGKQAYETIKNFYIEFKTDGSFAGKLTNARFEGSWSADGKEHTISLNIPRKPTTSNNYEREFIQTLQNVIFYNGDSNYLMLGPEDKKSYIQFGHK